jgi:hypothetical protein
MNRRIKLKCDESVRVGGEELIGTSWIGVVNGTNVDVSVVVEKL